MEEKKKVSKKVLSAEEKLDLQIDLIHMTVHDLKGPLMEINSNIDLVLNSNEIGENEREFARTAMEGCTQMYNLVTDLLNLGKLEAGAMILEKTKFDIGEQLEKEVRFFSQTADGNSVKVNIERSGNLKVVADKTIIGRVIANLVSNALKFSSPKSEVNIVATGTDGSAKIVVRDYGPGIPSEYRERIFDKYVQVELRTHRKPGGTGLGLPFCKLAVEAHNGEIGTSDMKDGTEFYFMIPKNG